MFGTIRKHQTWLWAFLAALMSISLVALFTSDYGSGGGSGGGGRRSQADLGSINGQPINQSDYLDAWKEIRIASFLHNGKWPGNDEAASRRMESETISRVFILKKIHDMDIKASDRTVGLMVQEQLKDYPYASLEKEILQPNGLTVTDYERYVHNEAAIRQLIAAASVSARLVNASEAEALWRKENQETIGQIACFWTSNFLGKVVVTNGAVGSFYTNRMNLMYRLPERLTLSYVAFPTSNFLADADVRMTKLTNLNEIISDYYFRARGGTNAWTDTNGNPLPETAAREKIREEIRQSEALIAARRAANDFGNELITQPDANKLENFEKLATARTLTVQVSKPFDSRTNGLEEFDQEPVAAGKTEDALPETLRDVVRQKAFALTEERPIQFSPIPGRHAVYVIARKGKVPSELQPLAKIQDKVAADYRNFMALDLARKAGFAFQTTLTNGLALKKTFNELCAAEKVPVLDLPAFAPTTKAIPNLDARINMRQLQGVADTLEIGKTSSFLPGMPGTEGGYIFYVKSRPPVDEAKLKADLPEFINQLRVYRQNEAFQQWFRKQAEQAKLSAPRRETSIGTQN